MNFRFWAGTSTLCVFLSTQKSENTIKNCHNGTICCVRNQFLFAWATVICEKLLFQEFRRSSLSNQSRILIFKELWTNFQANLLEKCEKFEFWTILEIGHFVQICQIRLPLSEKLASLATDRALSISIEVTLKPALPPMILITPYLWIASVLAS